MRVVRQVHWLSACCVTVLALGIVALLARVCLDVPRSEWRNCIVFSAVVLSVPLALCLAPLYAPTLQRVLNRFPPRSIWLLAPARLLSSACVLVILLIVIAWGRSHDQADTIVFPFKKERIDVWTESGFVGVSLVSAPADRVSHWSRGSRVRSFSNKMRNTFHPFSVQQGVTFADGNWVLRRSVMVPLWALLLVFSIPPMLSVLFGFLRLRRRRGHVCFKCTYDLTGNTSGACPECGTPIAVPSQLTITEESPDPSK